VNLVGAKSWQRLDIYQSLFEPAVWVAVLVPDEGFLAASEFELHDRRNIHSLETANVIGFFIREPCVYTIHNFHSALAWGPQGGGPKYWRIDGPVEERLGRNGILEADGPWADPGGCRVYLHQRITLPEKLEGLTQRSRDRSRNDHVGWQLFDIRDKFRRVGYRIIGCHSNSWSCPFLIDGNTSICEIFETLNQRTLQLRISDVSYVGELTQMKRVIATLEVVSC